MIIDENDVKDGVTPEILRRLISRHEQERTRFSKLKRYYEGKHDILGRLRDSPALPNNRIVANHARYITDMTVSYLISNPVTYSASEGFDIEAVKREYFEQSISAVDCILQKDSSIYGTAYEVVYADENAKPRSASLPPENTFIVYSDTADRQKLFGINYYTKVNIDGHPDGAKVIVYMPDRVIHYKSDTQSFSDIYYEKTENNFFGGVSLIEYPNNEEKMGDFEDEISLIDAYNLLMSDRVNDKEQFVDSFLLLQGIEIDSEHAEKLRREKILIADIDGNAKYLSKTLSESDTEVLRTTLKEDIHRFSMVPDLSDDTFANNLSGVAIRYKLMGFEQKVRTKERYMERSLKERFSLYSHFLNIKQNIPIVPVYEIDVEFKRNLPVNEYETARMINLLDGIVSRETLLSRLPFVTDAVEEKDIKKEEHIEENITDAIKEENYAGQNKKRR